MDNGAAQFRGLATEAQGDGSSRGRGTERFDLLAEEFGRVTPASQEDASGIVYSDNEAGASSPIVGVYPARDTALVEPRPVGGRPGGHRPRAEHGEHRADHALRDRPALQGAHRARFPGGVGRVLLE